MEASLILIMGDLTIEQWTAIANIALTVGLLFFACMQWWVTHQSEKSRSRDRLEDRAAVEREAQRLHDIAFQTVWAEQFRMEALGNSWGNADLVLLSSLGVLRATDLLPKDWSVVIKSLCALSVEAGFLGGVALALAHDAERDVATLNAIVEGFSRQYPSLSPAEIANMVRTNRREDVGRLEASIRRQARDLGLLLWDAARQSKSAELDRNLDFRNDMWSDAGKSAVATLVARGSSHVRSGGQV